MDDWYEYLGGLPNLLFLQRAGRLPDPAVVATGEGRISRVVARGIGQDEGRGQRASAGHGFRGLAVHIGEVVDAESGSAELEFRIRRAAVGIGPDQVGEDSHGDSLWKLEAGRY